jgi:arylsulfatase
MRARHALWKTKYPDSSRAHGPAFTGLANARAETKALVNPPVDLRKLPFDRLEYIDYELPDDGLDPDLGQWSRAFLERGEAASRMRGRGTLL